MAQMFKISFSVYTNGRVRELADAPVSDVQKCLDVLSGLKEKCFAAGYIHDAISQLANLSELRRASFSHPQGDGTDESSTSSLETSSKASPSIYENIPSAMLHSVTTKGRRRSDAQLPPGKRARTSEDDIVPEQPGSFGAMFPGSVFGDLPTHTNELGISTFLDQPNFFSSSPKFETGPLLNPNLNSFDALDIGQQQSYDLHMPPPPAAASNYRPTSASSSVGPMPSTSRGHHFPQHQQQQQQQQQQQPGWNFSPQSETPQYEVAPIGPQMHSFSSAEPSYFVGWSKLASQCDC